MDQPGPTGLIENVSVLDLTSVTADDLSGISGIRNVAVVLVAESLSGALARVPTKNVASVVAVPDGAEVKVHTGAVVLGGDALENPDGDDVVMVVTGTLAFSSPVQRIGYRQLIVTGMVLAPYGSESALAAGLTRVTGSVGYFQHTEHQRFQAFSGQTTLSGASLANPDGDPSDILFLTGQTVISSPVEKVGYQHIVAAGQVLAPRESEVALAAVLTVEGQLIWYGGRPRFFSGTEHFSRGFFDLHDEPLAMALIGSFSFDADVPPELLREKLSEITLVGTITAPKALHPVLQLLVTEKHGRITLEQGDGGHG